jgi:hypothetical protein
MTRYAPTRSLVNSTPDFPNGLTFNNGLTSNSGEVLLTQNSDQYGTNLLRMQNRTGTNGIILDASLGQSGIDLMDMAFRAANTTYGLTQQQIRMEGRSSALARTGGYGNEIQIGTGVRFCKKGGFIGPTTGLIATLVAGSFTVVLTTGSTATLVVGQGFSKTANSGVLGTGATITEIDPANTTTFTVSVAHATAGQITFTAVAPNHVIESMGTSSSADFNTWLGTSGVTYAVGTLIIPTSNGSALNGSDAILKYFPSHWHMIINSGGTTIRGGTASTSTTTGTLVVGGGVGISGSANVGGSLTLGSGEGTATVAGNTLRGPSAVGTDIAGGSLTIAGGTSTGAGAGGSIIFQTAPVGSTGTAVNALTERMRITSTGVRMTLSTTPTVGQVLASTDTSGTLGWSSGTTYYRQFMFTS